MNILHRTLLLIVLLCCSLCAAVAQKVPSAGQGASAEAPNSAVTSGVRISFIVCTPGSEVYELEGHAALRVVMPGGRDMAVNYGVFDFNSPNFIYRFVKGETDYMVVAYPFSIFLDSYRATGRGVIEYPLNLTAEESEKLLELLQINLLPENQVYRYNYVKDNCATRPLALVEKAIGDTLTYTSPDYTAGWSFRDAMTYYHRNYPWYQFGIDLALGSGIDYAVSEHEKVFAPYLLVSMLPGATFTDAEGHVRTLVGEPVERCAAAGGGPLAPTPWCLTPMAVAIYLLVIVAAIALFDVKRKRVTSAVDALYMAVAGMAGIVVTFLVFVSTHEATTPNLLIVWLNPLCFIVPACIFIKRCRRLVLCYEILNFVALILLCVLWPLTCQVANSAVWLFIVADIILSARYIFINALCAKK
jgi:hypothetical protein